MVFEISYIVAPVLGGVIGYITNDIAIRMLFRPHKPKYILGMKIPFTPGIIPKEKGRIAKALGTAISDNLMNKDVLEKNLLSYDMMVKIKVSVESFFETQKHNSDTVREFMLHLLSEEEVDKLIAGTRENLTEQIAGILKNSNLGGKIADVVVKHVSDKLRNDGLGLDIPGMLKVLIGDKLWNSLAEMIETPAKEFLTKNVNQMLENNGEWIVGNLVEKGITDITALQMQQLLEGKDEQIEQITDTIMGLYKTIIRDYLPRILEAIDIPHIIENRINEMDMAETEKIILQVMNKELRAIVWLGALLGLVMGSVNILI